MPLRFFQRSQPSADKPTRNIITVVSGLPRSGTSMMMRMLEAGGIPVLTDHTRSADHSNPKGYYEYESVKRMKEGDTGWVRDARGKAVKVISALLEYLPPDYEYRIVFMQRNMSEILASQRAMLIERGENNDRVGDLTLANLYQKHLARITGWIDSQPNLRVIYIDYNKIIEDPQLYFVRLVRFLHPIPLDTTKMLSTIETSLYRQRGDRPDSPTLRQT